MISGANFTNIFKLRRLSHKVLHWSPKIYSSLLVKSGHRVRTHWNMFDIVIRLFENMVSFCLTSLSVCPGQTIPVLPVLTTSHQICRWLKEFDKKNQILNHFIFLRIVIKEWEVSTGFCKLYNNPLTVDLHADLEALPVAAVLADVACGGGDGTVTAAATVILLCVSLLHCTTEKSL